MRGITPFERRILQLGDDDSTEFTDEEWSVVTCLMLPSGRLEVIPHPYEPTSKVTRLTDLGRLALRCCVEEEGY